LKLKNQMLVTQIKKLSQQLQEKLELGEGLSQIDFDQLKIENKQYFDKIHERNQELLRLKLTAGNTNQVPTLYTPPFKLTLILTDVNDV